MSKSYLVIFLLSLLSFQAWGATGSAAVDTWYVRPVEDCVNNGDGLAYGCAASAGATGAFRGFANLIWTVTVGIDDGDTLKICGTFYDTSSKTSGTRMLSVEGSGGASAEIIFDGDCSANGNLSQAILNGEGTVDHGIRTLANTYLKFRNLWVRNFDSRGIILYNNSATDVTIAKFITIEATVAVSDIRKAAATTIGIDGRGQDITLTGVRVSNIGEDAIWNNGKRFTVTDAVVSRVSQDGVLGDCFQMAGEVDGTVLDGLTCDHSDVDAKQCVVINAVTDTPTYSVRDVDCSLPVGATTAIGVILDGTALGERIRVRGGNFGVIAYDVAGANVTLRSNVISDTTAACISSGSNATTVTAYNNTLHNCGVSGITFGAATNTRTLTNNTITGVSTRGINKGTSGTTETYNNIFGPTTPVLSNGTQTSAHSSDLAVPPDFVGGSSPSSASGFRLSSSSALRRAGSDLGIGNIQDYGNRAFSHPPSIGAYEVTSGDISSSRTIATTRSARN